MNEINIDESPCEDINESRSHFQLTISETQQAAELCVEAAFELYYKRKTLQNIMWECVLDLTLSGLYLCCQILFPNSRNLLGKYLHVV